MDDKVQGLMLPFDTGNRFAVGVVFPPALSDPKSCRQGSEERSNLSRTTFSLSLAVTEAVTTPQCTPRSNPGFAIGGGFGAFYVSTEPVPYFFTAGASETKEETLSRVGRGGCRR